MWLQNIPQCSRIPIRTSPVVQLLQCHLLPGKIFPIDFYLWKWKGNKNILHKFRLPAIRNLHTKSPTLVGMEWNAVYLTSLLGKSFYFNIWNYTDTPRHRYWYQFILESSNYAGRWWSGRGGVFSEYSNLLFREKNYNITNLFRQSMAKGIVNCVYIYHSTNSQYTIVTKSPRTILIIHFILFIWLVG